MTELDPTTVSGLAEHLEIVATNLEVENHWEEVETYARRLRLAAAKLKEQRRYFNYMKKAFERLEEQVETLGEMGVDPLRKLLSYKNH